MAELIHRSAPAAVLTKIVFEKKNVKMTIAVPLYLNNKNERLYRLFSEKARVKIDAAVLLKILFEDNNSVWPYRLQVELNIDIIKEKLYRLQSNFSSDPVCLCRLQVCLYSYLYQL